MKKTIKSLLAIAVAAFAFTACSDVPTPEGYNPEQGDNVYPFDPTGAGTITDPYTSADAIAYCRSLKGQESTNKVFIKGKVSKIETTFEASGTYGNAVFYISDDGNADVKDQQFYVYRALYLGNKKWAKGDTDIKVGDDVVVKARVINYKNNTPETVSGTAFIYSLNGVDRGDEEGGGGDETADQPKGTGAVDNPFNVAAAVAKCKEVGETATTEEYYIKGKVKTVTEQYSTNYGNATFTIVDDGFTQIFTAYRVLYLGNKKFAAGDTEIKEGDEVIIKAKVVNFKGNTPETSGGFLYSLNGNTGEGGGGGDETADQPKGTGAADNPFNVAGAVAKCKEIGTTPSTQEFYVKGVAAADASVTDATNKNITVDLVDDGFTQQFKAYRVIAADGKKLKYGYKITKGATVIVCGKLVNYNETTPEISWTKDTYNGTLVSVNGQAPELDEGGEGGGGEGGGGSSTITRSVDGLTLTLTNTAVTASTETATIDFTALGWTHQQENPNNTSNGISVAFTKGDGSTTPKYWQTGNYDEIRMYAKNVFTVTGTKPIAKIVATCTTDSGTDRVGNSTMTASASGNTWTIINEHSAPSGGVQLRMKSIVITYAQ